MKSINIALFIKENPYGRFRSSTTYVFKELLNHCKHQNIKFILFSHDYPIEKLPENVIFRKVSGIYTFNCLLEFIKYIRNKNKIGRAHV